ncbi:MULTISPECIES: hypothetical protein [Pontibacillus]|uniref:Uncharacterized protein n=1 Tax=Pontibacillus chungwhensis TaxID=265426 RepID=A0ABY8V3S6_9BACI|nr:MULTISPECIES: hypothetical protein [Pontibacillus]MCD5322809.1 hypothetical protein [Pontibacillus sp. HN14]WIG00079.1 hypothetical protein QNI29_10605 [Pontibacillus chungwhensis]
MKGTAVLQTQTEKVIVLEDIKKETFDQWKQQGGYEKECNQTGNIELMVPVQFTSDIDWSFGY